MIITPKNRRGLFDREDSAGYVGDREAATDENGINFYLAVGSKTRPTNKMAPVCLS
jgi:hypothetical protein